MQLNKLAYQVTVVLTVNMDMVLLETWIFKTVETILMIKKAFMNDSENKAQIKFPYECFKHN